MPRFGFGVRFRAQLLAGAPLYSAEASAYFAAMDVQPDATRKGHIETLIGTLKGAGVWAKLDWLALHAANTSQVGRINLKNPAQVATIVNSPAFTADRGFTSDGATSYLNPGINPFLGGINYLRDDCHMGVWAGTELNASNRYDLGATAAGLNARTSAGAVLVCQDLAVSTMTLAVATSIGHTVWTRSGASVAEGYKNGASRVDLVTPSVALRNAPITICGSNGSTTGTAAPSGFSTRRLQATHFGGALTDAQVASFYSALSTYMTAIGA